MKKIYIYKDIKSVCVCVCVCVCHTEEKSDISNTSAKQQQRLAG